MRKRSFTLLEVLIALGLTLLTLSFLLGSYFYIERNSIVWRHQEEELFQQRYVQHRLEEVFASMPTINQNEEVFFTTEGGGLFLPGTPSLVFSYNNGMIFNNPALSGSVLGRLYVDRQGQLTLLTWPKHEAWIEGQVSSFHREVLITGIKNLQLDFFQIPPPQDNEAGKTQWQKVWLKDWKYSPGIIRMIFQKEGGQPLSFYFLIPSVISVIKEAAT